MNFIPLIHRKNGDIVDGELIKKPYVVTERVITKYTTTTAEDGTIVTLETSEQACCAGAIGKFKEVKLDAVITDVKISEMETISEDEYDGKTNAVEVFIFHNQNTIAKANMEADDGNGGYYYSVGSIVINNVHFPIVEA